MDDKEEVEVEVEDPDVGLSQATTLTLPGYKKVQGRQAGGQRGQVDTARSDLGL